MTDAECIELIERYTGLLLSANNPDIQPSDVQRLQQQAVTQARQHPKFSQCRGKVSRRGWQCAMDAHSADAVERCLLL